jgi:F-box and leucine-rich repeat protein GRR1
MSGERQSRTLVRRNSNLHYASSASTSPERGNENDDDDVFYQQPNESVSSITPSEAEEQLLSEREERRREIEERCRVSPVSRLPAEIMIAIFQRLPKNSDLRNCMLVSKEWARNSVALLWHRPTTGNWLALHNVVNSLRSPLAFFDYERLVKRLNLSLLNNHISDGVLMPFAGCKRIERLTLTGCTKLSDLSIAQVVEGNRSLMALDVTGVEGVTDESIYAVARNCYRLQGLNITNCEKVTDASLVAIAENCRYVKRLKFNGCGQLTDTSIIAFAKNCRQILEIDLADCRRMEDEAVTALITEGLNLRELRLAHCVRITDDAFLKLPNDMTFESLRILDLTDCGELRDEGVSRIIQAAPRLRNLVLAKCRQITDRAVMAITRLGKNLHYIHLGHCSRITDAGVLQLVKLCNRIRYIDLACCTNLTDSSITALANLPKLKRIGLVKCGNITDVSIHALATKTKNNQPPGSPTSPTPSSLERVHLSYCTNLTLSGITSLLNNCPRLTHLSLTGVQGFLREDLLVFCREAPPEFNHHQRDVFCVFSGNGVGRLRAYLNSDQHAQGMIVDQDGDPLGDLDDNMMDDFDDNNNSDLLDVEGPTHGPFLPAHGLGLHNANLPPPPPPPPQHHHLHGHHHPNVQALPLTDPHQIPAWNSAVPSYALPIPMHPINLPPLRIPEYPQNRSDSPTQDSPTQDAPLSVQEGEEFNQFAEPDEPGAEESQPRNNTT